MTEGLDNKYIELMAHLDVFTVALSENHLLKRNELKELSQAIIFLYR